MKVIKSPKAEADLESIGDWIARDNPLRAVSFVREMSAACDDIGDHPELHPLFRGSRSLRKKLFYPYLILYRVRRDQVVIVSIRHGARRTLR